MPGRHTFFFACLLTGALAFFLCATKAQARNPFATGLAIFPATLFLDSQEGTTLYFASQSRFPLLEPRSVPVGPTATTESAVSLVLPIACFVSDAAAIAPSDSTLGKSGARAGFALRMNDAESTDETQERAENESLFYSATDATRGVSENAIRNGKEQSRTGRTDAGSLAAPPTGGLFSQSGIQAN